VSVEHADLPDELKAAAGDMVASIWKASQVMAQDSVAQLRFDAATAAAAARNAEVEAMATVDAASRELEQTRARLLDAEDQIGKLRQELSASAATNAGSLARIEDARSLLAQNHEMLGRERAEHATERERLEERTRLAEQRFIDMEKRALLDMDRERTASLRLQKALENERAAHGKSLEQLRAEYGLVQREVAKLREQLGALQNATTSLKDERDRAFSELSATRSELEAAIRQAARDAARAQHLEEELERLRIRAEQESKTPTAPTRKSETIRRRRHKNKADVT
jgi:chromosome segregation ATPase